MEIFWRASGRLRNQFVQALVTKPSIEAFDMPVLHRLARLYVVHGDLPL